MKEASGFSPIKEEPKLDATYYKSPDLGLMERVLRNPLNPRLSFGLYRAGKAGIGDVSRMTFEERQVILSSSQHQSIAPDILMKPASNLVALIGDPKPGEHPKGYIFLLEASQFFANSLPGSGAINAAMMEVYNVGINDLLDKFENNSLTGSDLNKIVADTARKPKNFRKIAFYLANRSAAYERRQEELYGEDLSRAKTKVKSAISGLADICKLPADKIELAHRQVDGTSFLGRGLLEEDLSMNAVGMYVATSFRVAIISQYRGLDLIELTGYSPGQIITHEVSHASAAQSAASSGLAIFRGEKILAGNEVNEAMTEYIARIARKAPIDSLNPDGSINRHNFYIPNVNALQQVRRANPPMFAELFNANYANPGRNLGRALDLFYLKFERQIGYKK